MKSRFHKFFPELLVQDFRMCMCVRACTHAHTSSLSFETVTLKWYFTDLAI